MILGKNLSKIKKTITIPKDIPLLEIKAGTYDIQRFIYWNFLKCWWSGDVPFEQSIATNFDWYYPEYAYSTGCTNQSLLVTSFSFF